jgi:hypothetical protein
MLYKVLGDENTICFTRYLLMEIQYVVSMAVGHNKMTTLQKLPEDLP